MQLPRDIFDRSPEEGARRVALGFLGDAAAAAERLRDPDDAEALHDFRVSVRRLRSAVRAYRRILGGAVGKKDRRALRRLQAETGGGRDAEVFLAWLEAQRGALTAFQQDGATWLGRRLEERRSAAMADIRGTVLADFGKIDARLRPRLARLETTVDLDATGDDGRPRFGDALAAIVRDHAGDLRDHAMAVAGAEDEGAAHETRITGKRFRYLLEPFVEHDPAARDLVRRAKKLQTVLGDLHDVHVFGHGLGDAVEEAAAEQARRLHALTLQNGDDPQAVRREQRRGERSGLLALTARAKEQADALFRAFREAWVEGGADALVADAEALARRLEGRRRDVEIERKLLLRAFPPEAEAGTPLEIHQGWLPGERLRERLRKTVAADGATTYTRTVKLGRGLTRTELEEATTAEVFDALWRLTEGCRVRKRRWRVEANGHVFEIDRFLDRDLVLAEVELEREDETVVLPAWLEAVVERDVTGEDAYVNLRLAR